MATKPQDTRIIECELEEVMHSSMMPFSEYVILDRALPRVEDGLKPVQRRILYSMFESGMTSEKKYNKAARAVGDCMGKYHPHGDSSIYDALVRMAQPFVMSEPLIDGHGNFGSVDGDGAAAMRYTEVRLRGMADDMLRDIEKDTVKWTFNFDDTLKEPETLPGKIPNLLVNGATGIAVGLATNIPPHNITEVIDGVIAYIDKPSIKLEEMMNYIKAPDFPTGGFIYAGDDLYRAYQTGRGKVIMRARTTIEKSGDKKQIVITELPYGVKKAPLLQKINEMRETNDKLKNIAEVIDASDKGGMRAMIKIKREGDAAQILKTLFKVSQLELAFNINMIAIANGRPQLLGLMDIIKYYTEYQRTIILKRSQYDLAAAKAREHILRGILIAITNIDKVIKIIKGSANTTECRQNLRNAFDISEKQAQAILDIKLARLTKLEVDKVKEEIAALLKLIDELTKIIASKTRQLAIVKGELQEVRRKYKRARRSQLIMNGVEVEKNDFDEVDLDYVEERKGIAVLTRAQNIKFMSNKAFNAGGINLNDASLNDIAAQYIPCDNSKPIYGFTNLGNTVRIDVNALSDDKWRNKGTALNKVAKLAKNEKVLALFNADTLEKNRLVFYTSNGMIKCSDGKEYLIEKDIFQAIALKNEGEEVVGVEIKEDDKNIFMATADGVCCNMESDIPTYSRRSAGVIGIQLNDGDKVICARQLNDEGEIVCVTDKGYAKRIIVANLKISKRNRKGIKLQDLNEKSGASLVMVDYVRMPYDIALVNADNSISAINTENITIENTMSKGKLIVPKNTSLINAFKHNIAED